MNRLLLMLALALTMLGFAASVSAQNIPSVRGLTPFTPQTRYMSLAGYLRWQYFVQNTAWISIEEATELVRSQLAQ